VQKLNGSSIIKQPRQKVTQNGIAEIYSKVNSSLWQKNENVFNPSKTVLMKKKVLTASVIPFTV
jgi:hypothetical protein